MNLTNFLKQLDAITEHCTTEQLISFLHDIGRVLSEHSREDFPKRLRTAGEITDITSEKSAKAVSGIDETYQLIRDHLRLIDSQEIEIEVVLNEAYDDWYDDISDEYYYRDKCLFAA